MFAITGTPNIAPIMIASIASQNHRERARRLATAKKINSSAITPT